jgi:hypothetical protein
MSVDSVSPTKGDVAAEEPTAPAFSFNMGVSAGVSAFAGHGSKRSKAKVPSPARVKKGPQVATHDAQQPWWAGSSSISSSSSSGGVGVGAGEPLEEDMFGPSTYRRHRGMAPDDEGDFGGIGHDEYDVEQDREEYGADAPPERYAGDGPRGPVRVVSRDADLRGGDEAEDDDADAYEGLIDTDEEGDAEGRNAVGEDGFGDVGGEGGIGRMVDELLESFEHDDDEDDDSDDDGAAAGADAAAAAAAAAAAPTAASGSQQPPQPQPAAEAAPFTFTFAFPTVAPPMPMSVPRHSEPFQPSAPSDCAGPMFRFDMGVAGTSASVASPAGTFKTASPKKISPISTLKSPAKGRRVPARARASTGNVSSSVDAEGEGDGGKHSEAFRTPANNFDFDLDTQFATKVSVSAAAATHAHADASVGGVADAAAARRRKDRGGHGAAGDDREHLAEMYRKEGSNLYKVNDFDRALDAFQKALSFASPQWPMRSQVRLACDRPVHVTATSVIVGLHPSLRCVWANRCWATVRRR